MWSPLEPKRAATTAWTKTVKEQLQGGIHESFLLDAGIRNALGVLLPHGLLQQPGDEQARRYICVGVRTKFSALLAFAHQRCDQSHRGGGPANEPAAKGIWRLVGNTLEQQRYDGEPFLRDRPEPPTHDEPQARRYRSRLVAHDLFYPAEGLLAALLYRAE